MKCVTRLLSFLFFLFFLLFSCQTSRSPSEESYIRPNILFIMSDDHTAQAWGVYGSVLDSLVKTPNIRRLAEEGNLLQNTFCTNSICVPSRAAILTGQYSHRNGVYTLSDPLNPADETVAKILQRNDYQTAIIGKWHLKTKPKGFDYYNVLPGQGRYHNPILRDSANWGKGGEAYEGFSADVIGDHSLQWLQNRDQEKPFFLMCHFKATHEPFDFPARYQDLYADVQIPEPENLLDFGQESSGRTFSGQVLEILEKRYLTNADFYPNPSLEVDGLDPEQRRQRVYQKFVKDFMRSGAAIDDNIGKLLKYLDETGLADNTVVIYTADQGYFLGEHGMMDKRMMYEEPLRMPFVIRYPPEIPAGSKTDDIILNTDFASLFLDFAGLDTPDLMQGRSFRQNLMGQTPSDWRNQMYYRYWLHQRQRPAHFGIRDERYKLIFFYGHPLDMTGTHPERTEPAWEFYDLEKDPRENHNAYDDPEYKEVIAQLKGQLLNLKKEFGDTDEKYPELKEITERYWD